jgi:glycogen(starch) synthase
MKVLMTADTVGGVWTYALELARALQPHGVEIVLATMGAPLTAAQRAGAAALPNLRVHQSTFRLEWMVDPWRDVDRAGEWLGAIEARERPDIVHLNGYAHAALGWSAPTLVVAHSCVRSWWRAVKGAAAPASWEEYTTRVTAGLRAAHLVVAPTHAMLAMTAREYGVSGRTRVIANGRDPAFVAPSAKERFILCAGRLWDEAKNLAALDAVAHALSWPVHVAGDGRDPDGRRSAFAALSPLGLLEPASLARWMSRAALYALPARYEPFGISALEAGLAGCALVLGDIPSLREVWGDVATFVAPDDRRELARTLRRLIDDPSPASFRGRGRGTVP